MMRQHTELWRRCMPPGSRAGSLAAVSSGGADELRLPSSICQIFNRRNCQSLAGVDTPALRPDDTQK
jgi:hypothetical protein